MRLFGRKPERYLSAVKNLPMFVAACWHALFVFKSPLAVIWGYVLRKPPSDGRVLLQSGHVIELSADAADIVTVFLIFARQDYGRIVPGTTVVDVGANIGVFALFAALGGARVVHAYEPSASSYDCLKKNIEANGLENVIIAERRAVVGLPSSVVKFPRTSSVMNAILDDASEETDYDLVPAVTFSEIVGRAGPIDMLKLDCEGGEYDIFLNTAEADVRKTAEIRMEYHHGPRDEMIARLSGMGYAVRQFMDEGAGAGYLWLTRTGTT